VTVSGALACRVVSGTGRRLCLVRTAAGDVLQEAVAEVSAQNAPQISSRLVQTVLDAMRLVTRAPVPLEAPKEVVSALTCTVDSSKLEVEGRRRYVFRAAI
jgi:hypothetical protein